MQPTRIWTTSGDSSAYVWAATLNQFIEIFPTKAVRSNGSINSIIRLTQAAYNALSPKDPNTFYVIVG